MPGDEPGAGWSRAPRIIRYMITAGGRHVLRLPLAAAIQARYALVPPQRPHVPRAPRGPFSCLAET